MAMLGASEDHELPMAFSLGFLFRGFYSSLRGNYWDLNGFNISFIMLMFEWDRKIHVINGALQLGFLLVIGFAESMMFIFPKIHSKRGHSEYVLLLRRFLRHPSATPRLGIL